MAERVAGNLALLRRVSWLSALGPRALQRLAGASHRREVRTTHEELASLLGVTRETVSRALKALERAGAVRLRRGRIELRAGPGVSGRPSSR